MIDINEYLSNLAEALIKTMRNVLELQGHRLTGRLSDSLTYEIQAALEANEWVIEFLGENYGRVVNTGVKASNIPFSSKRKTGARTSQYIQGLKAFAKKRFFLSDKAALGVAFAIAKKHEKEGMPSRGSFKFSQTGKRTDFINISIEENRNFIEQVFNDMLLQIAQIELN